MKDLMMSSRKLSRAIIAKVTRKVFTQTKPLKQSRNVQQSENTRKIPSNLQEEQKLLDDNIVPAYDPIWWFVRYPLDMLWVMQVGTDYPRINMFGEEVPNLLQTSGYHAVLENTAMTCSCPARTGDDHSGFFEVTGVTAGKPTAKESGFAVLGSLPPTYRARLSQELRSIVRQMMELNESSHFEHSKSKSISMMELASPEKSCKMEQLKVESPLRYRSLDTLTRDDIDMPPPGILQKPDSDLDVESLKKRRMVSRQATYTIRRPHSIANFKAVNKTSSPIQSTHSLLDLLEEAEQSAAYYRDKLAQAINELREGRDVGLADDSLISLLDASKISIPKVTLKQPESLKSQFASSPNLSGAPPRDQLLGSSLRRTDSSASTSKLASLKRNSTASTISGSASASKVGEKKVSKLRRLSPNFFKAKKDDKSSSIAKDKSQDSKNRFQNMFKSKVAVPVRVPPRVSSANLDGSRLSLINKQKFSYVKSTIPKRMSLPPRND